MMRAGGVIMYSSLRTLGPITGVVVRVVRERSEDEAGAGLVVVADLVHNIIFSLS
jgi:hypothetical protein